ncbi:glycosyltransferase family 87 protein [Kitasatospora sp. NPDC085895]|uniref:glycosyltransferase family 87 protein n=1 Tax=Kitasatospora sp. NPDC085895 TaxID=3155057 RepID=UPI00344B8BD2
MSDTFIDAPDRRTRTRAQQAGLFRRWWSPRTGAALGYWACTRMVMITTMFSRRENVTGEVHHYYQKWAEGLLNGSFPVGDVTWQYPPGAAAVVLAPELLPGLAYVPAFVVVVLAADLAVTAALLRASDGEDRSTAGPWLWIVGLPLLTFVPYARYDVVVAAFAVAALLALRRMPWLGGGLAAVGALVKVWPAFAVFGAPRGRSLGPAVAGFVASAAALTGVMCFLFDGAFAFLDAQGGRGVEFESLGGTVLLVWRFFGYPGHIEYRYGSMEFVGPHVDTIAAVLVLLSVLGFCWLLVWRLRARVFTVSTPADAALAAVLVFTVTSRVISPQYFVWLLAVGAVCLTRRATTQRTVVYLVVLATALTTVEFPLFFEEAVRGDALITAVLVARNLVLLAAALLSCAALWRATTVLRPRPAGSRP